MRNTICSRALRRLSRIFVQYRFVFIEIMLSARKKIFINRHPLKVLEEE